MDTYTGGTEEHCGEQLGPALALEVLRALVSVARGADGEARTIWPSTASRTWSSSCSAMAWCVRSVFLDLSAGGEREQRSTHSALLEYWESRTKRRCGYRNSCRSGCGCSLATRPIAARAVRTWTGGAIGGLGTSRCSG